MENLEHCCNPCLEDSFVRLIIRIMPFLLALWHFADIGLDINQSITFYRMAYDNNGSYQNWSLQYQNATSEAYLQTLSPWYFNVGLVIWILPSLLCTIIFCVHNFSSDMDKFPGSYTNTCFPEKIKTCGSRLCSVILITVFVIPIGTIVCFLLFYLVFPITLLWNAIHAVVVGDKFSEEKTYGCCFPKKSLIFLKLLEIAGEALPQLILNITFMLNNYPYLAENDVYFGIPVPISVISAIFSIGSLIIGVKSGCKTMNR